MSFYSGKQTSTEPHAQLDSYHVGAPSAYAMDHKSLLLLSEQLYE